ncbi:hypothetical protein [Dactylosporangium cerinum]
MVHAERDPSADGSDGLRLTLLTEGGVPFQTLPLQVLPRSAATAGRRPAAVEGPLIRPVPRQRTEPPARLRREPRRSALLIAATAGGEAVGDVLHARHGFGRIMSHAGDTVTRIAGAYEELIATTGPGDAVVVHLHGRALRHPPDDTDGGGVLPVTTAELDAFHRRLTAVTANVTVIYDIGGLDQTWRTGHPLDPQPVELYSGASPGPAREPNPFAAELARALGEAAGLRVTWATLVDEVCRRVLRLSPEQRPAVVGPAQRVLFGTAEARGEPTLPVVVSKRGDLVRLSGARLLNVQIGDEFAILAGGADGQPVLGTATVEGLAEFGAYARLELLDAAMAVPAGAVARRTRAAAERIPVRLPPLDDDLARLHAAVRSSTMLRPSGDDGWVYEVRGDDRHRLTILDRIGPLSDPVSAMSGSGRVLADLERLARATALRRLANGPVHGFEPVAAAGLVVDGAPVPLDGSALLYPGDRISISLRNDNTHPVHVSLVDVGVAADVTVLTASSPSGIRLDPGARHVVDGTDLSPGTPGLRIEWPAGLAPAGPRPETILVITTAEPHDLGSLGQRRVRAPLRDSPLARALAQASYGIGRATGDVPDDGSGAYAIRAIRFDLAPGARPVAIPDDWPAPGSIMTAAELRDLAPRFRQSGLECDASLVARIVSDVAEYDAYARTVPGPTPPQPLDELLPLMGWLLYEASWDAVQRLPAMLNATMTAADELRRGLDLLGWISALADAARRLPWPAFAGRALGAIRAQALAESKRDTEAGYDVAWIVHQEANRRYYEYRESLATAARRERYVRDLDEMLLQLALAETGTACRKAERVISRWPEEFADDDEDFWVDQLFGDLTAAAVAGELAIDTGRRIQQRYGFADTVTEQRLALHTALQNPGIMTARVSTLLLALGPAIRRTGRLPGTFQTWEQWEAHELGRFTKAYQTIEAPVLVDRRPEPMRPTVLRQLIHMRLNLALLKPGYRLPSSLSLDPVLQLTELDDAALAALSDRLAPADGRPGRERGVGAAMMPAVIRSIRACRGRGPEDRSYDRWRVDWFRLDRFSNESGRRTRLDEALAASR